MQKQLIIIPRLPFASRFDGAGGWSQREILVNNQRKTSRKDFKWNHLHHHELNVKELSISSFSLNVNESIHWNERNFVKMPRCVLSLEFFKIPQTFGGFSRC